MAARRKSRPRITGDGPAQRRDDRNGPPGAAHAAQCRSWTTRPRAVQLIVAGLACGTYLNVLPNGFAYDDHTIVRQNERIRAPANFREIWLTDWWHVPPERTEERHRDRLYRPLVVQTYAVNYAVSGLDTWSYHLFDILLHGMTCVTVVALTRRLFRDPHLAAWTGVIFAVLPIHSESVAYIVGRADVMAALFCLWGVLSLTHELTTPGRNRRRAYRIGAVLCVPLGLFCKEQAICLPALMVLTEWYLRRNGRTVESGSKSTGRRRLLLRRFGALYFWVVLGVVWYLVLRYVSLEHHLVRDVPPAALDNPLTQSSWVQRIWTPCKVLAQYLLLTIWPANLCSDYSYNALPLASSPLDVLTFLGVVVVTVAAWACLRSARQNGTVLYIVLFFALSYALISNAGLLIGTLMGERLFYLPSLPVCWLLVLGVRSLIAHPAMSGFLSGPRKALMPALACGAVLVMTLRTIMRNADWHDGERLFTVDVLTHPQSARLQLFRARDLIRLEDWDAAREHLRKALDIFPEYADAHASAGFLYAVNGDWEPAKKHYMLALQLLWENPALQAQYESFRRLYEEETRLLPQDELPGAQRAAATQPADIELQLRLADLQAGLGKYRDGILTLRRALAYHPDDRGIKLKLANLLMIDEQFDDARAILEGILTEDDMDWRAHTHLAYLLAGKDRQACLRHARRAVEIQPDRFEPRMNLIQALQVNKRYEQALRELRALLAVIPSGEPARPLIQRQIRMIEDAL